MLLPPVWPMLRAADCDLEKLGWRGGTAMDSVGEYDDDGTGPLEAFLIGAELFFSSTPIEANESDSKLESASFAIFPVTMAASTSLPPFPLALSAGPSLSSHPTSVPCPAAGSCLDRPQTRPFF